jgi:hypothetical protein
VAALQILTGQRLEKVLRTSVMLLEKDSGVLKPAQKAAVEGFICERMGEMGAGGLKNLLREVFTDKACGYRIGRIFTQSVTESKL